MTISVYFDGFAPVASTELYRVADGNRGWIDKCEGYSAAGGTVTFNIVPPGGTLGASNVRVVKTFGAGEAYLFPEMIGQPLVPGNSLSCVASGASLVTLRIGGRMGT